MATPEQHKGLIDPLAGKLGYELRRASLMYLGHLTEVVEGFGLRVTEATFLFFVAANPDCNQGEISRALGVKRTNMVPTVNALVERGLVTRKAADGRTNALTLTPEGRQLHDALSTAIDHCDAMIFQDIEVGSLSTFMSVVDQIRSNARRVESSSNLSV